MKADPSQRKIGKHELLLLYPKKKLIAYTLSSSPPPWINISSFCPKVVVMISLVVQFICVPCTWVSWVGRSRLQQQEGFPYPVSGCLSVPAWAGDVGGGISAAESDHRRWMRARGGWFHSTGEISQYHDKIRQLQDFQISRKVIEHARTRNRSSPHRMCASKTAEEM